MGKIRRIQANEIEFVGLIKSWRQRGILWNHDGPGGDNIPQQFDLALSSA